MFLIPLYVFSFITYFNNLPFEFVLLYFFDLQILQKSYSLKKKLIEKTIFVIFIYLFTKYTNS